MLIESLLPLGKLDPGLREPETPLHIADFAATAALAGSVGLDPGRNIRCYCVPAKSNRDGHVGFPCSTLDRSNIRTRRSILPPSVQIRALWRACMKPLIGTAPDQVALERVIHTVRTRVAFYLSTPSYRRTFELHGWGDIAREALELSRANR
ncbi:MAG: hypothetical protein ACI81L_002781 [Verrucomicrobiales bacterium]|jgi:hypothetical protein